MARYILIVVLGVLSSVIASWLSPYTRLPGPNEPGLVGVLLAPVPAVAFFGCVAVCLALYWAGMRHQAAKHDKKMKAVESDMSAERAALESQLLAARQARDALAKQLEPRFELAWRIIATVKSPPTSTKPTRDEICKAVVSREGNARSAAEVETSVGWMLGEKVLQETLSGTIEVNFGWEERLKTLERSVRDAG